jgi:hypothetical protein
MYGRSASLSEEQEEETKKKTGRNEKNQIKDNKI